MTLSRHGTAVWLLLILALAAFLRLWQLDTFPPGLYHDEAYNGLDALSLLQGKTFPQFYEGWELYAQDAHAENPPTPTRFPVFFEGNFGREPLHVYLMAASIRLFGTTPFAIRLAPAVAGVLGVWTTFLAAKALLGLHGKSNLDNRYKWRGDDTGHSREMLGQWASWIPLLAAFFLAILVPAVHFSRFGIRAMVFVPIEMLTVYFFWRGYNLSQRMPSPGHQRSQNAVTLSFLAAGFFLGLGIYTYAAARLFPLLFVLFVLFWAWRDWSGLRQNLVNLVGMTAVSLLTALPLLWFFWQYPYFFIFRIAFVANKGRGTVADQPLLTWLLNVGRVVRSLYWQGETHLRHNLPGRPYLDPIQALFFTLGLGQTLRQKLNPRTVFLLLWLLVMLLPTILSGDAPHFGRMTGAAGVISILAAIGIVWLFSVVSGQWSVSSEQLTAHRLLITVYCLLLVTSLGFTLRDYFGRYANHPQLATDFYLPDWQLGQFADAQGMETTLYLSPTQEELATIYFALADPDRMRNYSGSEGAIPAGIPGRPATYLLRPTETAVLQTLQSTFPKGSLAETPNDSFIAFTVPAQAARMPLAETAALSWEGQIELVGWSTEVEAGQLHVWLAWRAVQTLPLDYTAFVHLLGADGQILTQLDRPPAGYPTSDWRPGEIVLDRFVLPLPDGTLPTEGTILQTGFYHLPSQDRLGEPFVLTTFP